jgi:hypothetical protein
MRVTVQSTGNWTLLALALLSVVAVAVAAAQAAAAAMPKDAEEQAVLDFITHWVFH